MIRVWHTPSTGLPSADKALETAGPMFVLMPRSLLKLRATDVKWLLLAESPLESLAVSANSTRPTCILSCEIGRALMSWSVKLRNLDQSLSVIDPDPSNRSITFCRPAEEHASVEDEDEDEDEDDEEDDDDDELEPHDEHRSCVVWCAVSARPENPAVTSNGGSESHVLGGELSAASSPMSTI